MNEVLVGYNNPLSTTTRNKMFKFLLTKELSSRLTPCEVEQVLKGIHTLSEFHPHRFYKHLLQKKDLALINPTKSVFCKRSGNRSLIG